MPRRCRSADAWPLVLALAPPAFDRWAGLDPSGDRARTAGRRRARARGLGAARSPCRADVADLAVRPVGRWPGIAGITAQVSGTEQRGRIALRAAAPSFEWPRMFREPIVATRADGRRGLAARRQRLGAVLAGRAARASAGGGRGVGDVAPAGRGRSPVLDAEARVERLDVALVPRRAAGRSLQPRSLAWLEAAFRQGTASDGRVDLSRSGAQIPVPCRRGRVQGTCRCAGRDARHSSTASRRSRAPWAPWSSTMRRLPRAVTARATSAACGCAACDFAIDDYQGGRRSTSTATAIGRRRQRARRAAGQPARPAARRAVHAAVGPRSRRLLVAPEPADAGPAGARDYLVRTQAALGDRRLAGAARAGDAASPATSRSTTASFAPRRCAARSSTARSSSRVQPGPVGGEGSAHRCCSAAAAEPPGARAAGRSSACPIRSAWRGTADWRLDGRVERRGDGEQWSTRIEVATDLRGLAGRCAAAVREAAGRSASDARRARRAAAAAAPTCASIPARRARRCSSSSAGTGAGISSAARRASTRSRWRCPRNRACTSMATGPSSISAEWLALRPAQPGEQRLSDWLGPVDVHLDRARVLGFEFLDVTARLEPAADALARRGERADGGRYRGDPGRFHRRRARSAWTCAGWCCSRRRPCRARRRVADRSARPAGHRGPRRGFHLAGTAFRPAGRHGRPGAAGPAPCQPRDGSRRTSRSAAPAAGWPKARARARASRSSSRAPTSRPPRVRSAIAMSSMPSGPT